MIPKPRLREAYTLTQVTRRWLAKTPVLLTAYLVLGNRWRRRGRMVLCAALALSITWMAAVSLYVHADRAAAVSTIASLHRHDLLWATICAIAAGVLVSRRRTLRLAAAPRSWTAALPVERSTAKWQAIVVESVPALVLGCCLAAVFGSLSLIGLVTGSITAPIITWAATTGGVVLGAGLSYLLPSARQEEIYEGSRYVPHRRRAETPIPTGSLSALGSWPVRHMFASARPKTVARAMMPILLCVPLGSTAADAMLAIGLLTAIGILVLLVAAAISVSAKASRWLKPLPLGSSLLARMTLIPALSLVFCVAAIESWLMWVLGWPVARCIAIGIATAVASISLVVSGSLVAIHAGASRVRL
jgi:hypothetical protein